MSRIGAPSAKAFDAHALRIAVVAARWHEQISGALLDGALRAIGECRVEDPVVVRVPGAFELPVAAKALAEQRHDAIVALGVVIRGGTPHFEFVCRAATDGLTRVGDQHRRARGSRRRPPRPHHGRHGRDAAATAHRDQLGEDLAHTCSSSFGRPGRHPGSIMARWARSGWSK